MTPDDVVESALERLSGVADQLPSARRPYWRRVGIRQQHLFIFAARIDPEFYGVCAVGILEGGAVALAAAVPPVKTAAAITRIEVSDPGTSGLLVGAEIVPVPAMEAQDPHDHPRVLLRNRSIVGVGTDLANVTSIKIQYPYLPELPAEDGELELSDPWSELLVVDLAKWMLRRLPQVDVIAALYGELAAEEKEQLGEFSEYVANFATSRQRRFVS